MVAPAYVKVLWPHCEMINGAINNGTPLSAQHTFIIFSFFEAPPPLVLSFVGGGGDFDFGISCLVYPGLVKSLHNFAKRLCL